MAGVVWADTYDTLGEPPTQEELERFQAPFREDFVAATRAFVRRMSGPATPNDLTEWVAADMSAAPPKVASTSWSTPSATSPSSSTASGG